MRNIGYSFIFLLVALFSGCSSNQPTTADQLVIQEVSGNYELSVPKSRVVVSLPKRDFVVSSNHGGGATENPRYFYLQNDALGSVISGWFEPSERYVSLETSLNQEMASLAKRGFGSPQNVEPSQLGPWKIIIYNIPVPTGSSTHLRAAYIGSGTWIDLHISITSGRSVSESREALLSILRSIQIKEKS